MRLAQYQRTWLFLRFQPLPVAPRLVRPRQFIFQQQPGLRQRPLGLRYRRRIIRRINLQQHIAFLKHPTHHKRR